MTLEEFQESFAKLKKAGFIPSKRKGPTGVGHTLEVYLKLKENNIALPDLNDVELKAHRIASTSLITLFTFNKKAWKMKPIEAIRKHGTPDENGRLGLYFTMSMTPNSTGLFLHFTENAVAVRHINGHVIAEWQMQEVANQFMKKFPAMVLVSAFSEMRGDVEWFHYVRSQLLTETSADIIQSQIREGNVVIDLRLHDKGTSARNHGTGFRVREDKLQFLFKNVKDL